MSDTHIKINAVTPKVQYTGNGSTTVFPYEFAIFDDSEMNVYLGDTLQESGYTVSGAGQTEGGNVTFSTAPTNGTKITLIRNIPIERVTDFQEGGTFRPKNLNDEFDRQTAFLQQVQETLTRAVTVGPTSDVDPEEVVKEVEAVYNDLDDIKNAKTWAEGSDADVAAIGGIHSAKGWATQANTINVKDFGAIGDGITDDTTALQTAIDYAIDNQKSLFIPSGTYACSSLHSKGQFGHNNNMILKITGDYKSVISLTGSLTVADRLACDFSDLTIESTSTSDAALILGDYDYYCNRGSFRNVRIKGNPLAINFSHAFDIGFWDCRISSYQTYEENVNEMPVMLFGKDTNVGGASGAPNMITFGRCHFEGTAGNGTFVYMDDTYASHIINFLGCHFETRNYNSRAFHIKKGRTINFYGCGFSNNAYNGSGVTDTHTKAINYLEEDTKTSFIDCSWDRWDNKIININSSAKAFNFYGVSTTSFVSGNPSFSDIFDGATVSQPRWNIRLIQANLNYYSNECFNASSNKYALINSSTEAEEGSIYWFTGNGIVSKVGNDNLTSQKSGVFRPFTTNDMNLGDANHLWKEIFAANATINTSDERQKQDIADIDERVFKAWCNVEFKQFLFNDAVNKKGKENARVHFGLIAQKVKEAFEKEGLDPFKYGLLCYDEWDDEYADVKVIDKEAEYDENGEVISQEVSHTEKRLVQKAGNSYGIRYSEALALECAYQRWLSNKFEERLEKLESK